MRPLPADPLRCDYVERGTEADVAKNPLLRRPVPNEYEHRSPTQPSGLDLAYSVIAEHNYRDNERYY